MRSKLAARPRRALAFEQRPKQTGGDLAGCSLVIWIRLAPALIRLGHAPRQLCSLSRVPLNSIGET